MDRGTLCYRLLNDTQQTWMEVALLLGPPLSILLVCLLAALLTVRLLTGAWASSLPPFAWAFVIAFALIGIIPGIVAGYAREAVSGTFLTATVGVVSAMLSYAFAKSELNTYKGLIPFLIISTLIGALVGYGSGGVSKYKWLTFDQQITQSAMLSEKVIGPVDLERRQENLRRLIESKPDGFITAQELNATNFPETAGSERKKPAPSPSCF